MSSRIRDAVVRICRRALDALRLRPWQSAEIVLAVLFAALLIAISGPFIVAWLRSVSDAAASLVPLLLVDGAATASTVALGIGKIALAAWPSVLLIRSVPRRRRIWLGALVALLVIVSTPLSLASCATIDRWLLLALASGGAAALTRLPVLRWAAVLPFALLWEVVPSHGLLDFASIGTEDPAYRERLLIECARHDGVRPENLTADLLMPYQGVNSLRDDVALLTGEGPYDGNMRGHTGGRPAGSWWLRRRDGAFRFEQPSRATGNLWRGCVLDGTIWMARAHQIVGARLADAPGAHDEVSSVAIPSPDMDLGKTACDAEHNRVYVTEVLRGGLWEVALDGGDPRRYEIGGNVLLPKRRFDHRLIVSNTASFSVFDPDQRQVIERVPTALASAGFDVCGHDGTVAVADLAGRLRIFELGADGRYRFAWGISLFAPRCLAYSPDCSHIAVTSADDHSVFLIDTSARRIATVFRAGPALREVAATGPREFSVADICSMTTYHW